MQLDNHLNQSYGMMTGCYWIPYVFIGDYKTAKRRYFDMCYNYTYRTNTKVSDWYDHRRVQMRKRAKL